MLEQRLQCLFHLWPQYLIIDLTCGTGKAIAGHKLDCLATKFAFKFTAAAGFGVDGSREFVRSAVEASLKRLNVKQIDLYYQHRVDRGLPIEETWKALKVCPLSVHCDADSELEH